MTFEDLPGWIEFHSNTYQEFKTADVDTSLASVVTCFFFGVDWENIATFLEVGIGEMCFIAS